MIIKIAIYLIKLIDWFLRASYRIYINSHSFFYRPTNEKTLLKFFLADMENSNLFIDNKDLFRSFQNIVLEYFLFFLFSELHVFEPDYVYTCV